MGKKKKQALSRDYINKYLIGNSKSIDKYFQNVEPFIDLIVTSPPYWNMKNYENNKEQIGFGQTYDEYLHDVKQSFQNVFDISKSTASLVLIVDTLKKGGRMVRLPDDIARQLEEIGWIHQDTIIWDKVKTLPWSRKGQMRNVFEYILIFSKTKRYKYNMDSIRVVEDMKEWWIGYPERYNPKGKVPENIWEFLIPTQGSWGSKQNFGEKEFRHACPFPPELMARVIKLLSDPGDIVFDSFAGTGVLLAVARKLNRKFIAFDINETYKEVFEKVTIPLVDSVWDDIERHYEIQEKLKQLMAINIAKLRALKYPYALMKKQKEYDIFKIVIANSEPISGNDKIDAYTLAKVNYKLFVDTNDIAEISILSQKINEILSKAPFTKYGVLSNFEVYPYNEFSKHLNSLKFPQYLYSGSSFNNYFKEIESAAEFENMINNSILSELKEKNVCPVLSNIKIHSADYELLPAEEYKKAGYRDVYSEGLLRRIDMVLNSITVHDGFV